MYGLAALICAAARGADTLAWRADQDQVDANLAGCTLPQVLRKIAAATGWKIYYEPGSKANISVKFSNLEEDEALHRLLGKFNFAKETTNGVTHLLVFQTASRAATRAIVANKVKDYLIRNELLVKLKKNSPISIEDLAKQLHAKIVGRDDRIGLYRLQFDDEASATAALQSLSGDNSVAAVGHNYIVDPPTPAESGPVPTGAGGTPSPASLLNPKTPANGGLVIGLVDTAVQPQDGYSQYMLPAISVVGQADVPTDQPAHGTAMLDTMVQTMANNPSMIQPVTIYKEGEQTTTFEMMQGVAAAFYSGAQIISISSGETGGGSTDGGIDMLGSLIDAISQRGPIFVAAAGNTPGTTPTYPAAYPPVISVTALDPNGQLAFYADDFNGVKSAAPGTSFTPFGNQIWEGQGTSEATAFASSWIANTYNENQGKIPLAQVVNQWILLHPPPAK